MIKDKTRIKISDINMGRIINPIWGMEYILKSDTDFAMFYCDESLKTFYARHSWIHIENSVTFIGAKEQPERVDDEILMMLFISSKGQSGRQAFESKPIHFGGDHTW